MATGFRVELNGDGTIKPLHDQISLQALHNRCSILTEMSKLIGESCWKMSAELEKKFYGHVDKILLNLNDRKPHINQQELDDFTFELVRLKRISQLYIIESHDNFRHNQCYVRKVYEECKECIFDFKKYTNDSIAQEKLRQLAEKVEAPVITEAEKRMVVEAMTSREGTGRWFKCPNGHYYYIGDCGGAMQTGRCIECNAEIGGGDHSLLRSNRFAPEMDGSARPAWPTMGMNY